MRRKFTQPILDSSSPEDSSEGYGGDTPSPKPTQGWESGSYSTERELTDFNSPGPSEGGASVDSGFVKAKNQAPLLKQVITTKNGNFHGVFERDQKLK